MLRGGKNLTRAWDGLSYGGCSCHNSKREHRKAKKSVKQAEKKAWKKEYGL
jgi:hypothetical protein